MRRACHGGRLSSGNREKCVGGAIRFGVASRSFNRNGSPGRELDRSVRFLQSISSFSQISPRTASLGPASLPAQHHGTLMQPPFTFSHTARNIRQSWWWPGRSGPVTRKLLGQSIYGTGSLHRRQPPGRRPSGSAGHRPPPQPRANVGSSLGQRVSAPNRCLSIPNGQEGNARPAALPVGA